MKTNAKYKIIEVNGYWKYHVYRKGWLGWVKIKHTDEWNTAIGTINEDCAPRSKKHFFDAKGEAVSESKVQTSKGVEE